MTARPVRQRSRTPETGAAAPRFADTDPGTPARSGPDEQRGRPKAARTGSRALPPRPEEWRSPADRGLVCSWAPGSSGHALTTERMDGYPGLRALGRERTVAGHNGHSFGRALPQDVGIIRVGYDEEGSKDSHSGPPPGSLPCFRTVRRAGCSLLPASEKRLRSTAISVDFPWSRAR